MAVPSGYYNFTRHSAARGHPSPDKITITRTHTIGLPRTFYQKNGLDRFRYVTLYHDPAAQAIGLEFTAEPFDHSYALTRDTRAGAVIACRSFLRWARIDLARHSGQYAYKRIRTDDIPELYVIELNRPEP